MKTVLEVIRDLKAKPGDELTDGVRTWTIRSYKDERAPRESTVSFYLRQHQEGVHLADGPALTGAFLHFIAIPGLRRKPKTVRMYRYILQKTDAKEPALSEHHYPDGCFQHISGPPHELREAVWYKKLEKCFKDVEIDCDCSEGEDK